MVLNNIKANNFLPKNIDHLVLSKLNVKNLNQNNNQGKKNH